MSTSSGSGSAAKAANTAQEKLISEFYQAFSRRDAEAMVACYHPDIVFHDPAFGTLRGESAGDMWRMLCRSGKDLVVSASDIHASDGRGRAHWEADYTFGTGRKVHNVVDSRFDFAEGLIIRHTDDFNFDKWSAQAFGLPGKIVGYVPVLPEFSMQRLAGLQLKRFQDSRRK